MEVTISSPFHSIRLYSLRNLEPKKASTLTFPHCSKHISPLHFSKHISPLTTYVNKSLQTHHRTRPTPQNGRRSLPQHRQARVHLPHPVPRADLDSACGRSRTVSEPSRRRHSLVGKVKQIIERRLTALHLDRPLSEARPLPARR